MYLAAKAFKGKFLWRLCENDLEDMLSPAWAIFDLRLSWGKHKREWRLSVEQQGPKWTYAALRFIRIVNDKKEGWMLRGPIEKIYG